MPFPPPPLFRYSPGRLNTAIFVELNTKKRKKLLILMISLG